MNYTFSWKTKTNIWKFCKYLTILTIFANFTNIAFDSLWEWFLKWYVARENWWISNSRPIAEPTIFSKYYFMLQGFPVCFILCEKRTLNFYNAMLAKLKELVPQLTENIEHTICDYERALNSALRQAFPAARLQGCWFHYIQVIIFSLQNAK